MTSIKSFALIAAAATAFATASNATIFDFDIEQENVEVVTLDGVSAPAGSQLVIYDYRLGTQGEEKGSVDLAGSRVNLRVQLDGRAQGDLLAVLTGPSGEVLDTHFIEVDDN